MQRASAFTFGDYRIDAARSTVQFMFRVQFAHGRVRTYTDTLYFDDVPQTRWGEVSNDALQQTLRALHLMLGINYWAVFPARQIHIEGWALSREQAQFWDTLYLHGLAEFFYDMQMDFAGLIAFPWDERVKTPPPVPLDLGDRALILNGAGKDSILSAEFMRARGVPFDFFSFNPTPAHERIAKLVGADTVRVRRRLDPWVQARKELLGISHAYPSVSTFTFVAVLLAQLLGYRSIVLSNERSADAGNFVYRGLEVNHQWCKSSKAERMLSEYIARYITPDVVTISPLRPYSELEIVRRFVRYPRYLGQVTSCNTYFWLPRPLQHMTRRSYWCGQCPKCAFLFACFSASLPKSQVLKMFGTNLYAKRRLLPLFRKILGFEGSKPLDCVGEPEEMVLAMRTAAESGEYAGDVAIEIFLKELPVGYDFAAAKKRVYTGAEE